MTRESYLEIIAISLIAIVTVFLFGSFSRDQTVYIELDG